MKQTPILLRLWLLAAAMAAFAGCSTPMKPLTASSLTTVPRVDLDRYMGRWEVISYVPNFFENGKVATSDRYAKREDGKLDNVYAFRQKSLDAPEKQWKGTAWVTNHDTNAEWKVRVLWPFTHDYLILELDPDYRWAVVASNQGKLLWILARDRSLPEAAYRDLLKRIDDRGLDSSRLANVPQLAL